MPVGAVDGGERECVRSPGSMSPPPRASKELPHLREAREESRRTALRRLLAQQEVTLRPGPGR